MQASAATDVKKAPLHAKRKLDQIIGARKRTLSKVTRVILKPSRNRIIKAGWTMEVAYCGIVIRTVKVMISQNPGFRMVWLIFRDVLSCVKALPQTAGEWLVREYLQA